MYHHSSSSSGARFDRPTLIACVALAASSVFPVKAGAGEVTTCVSLNSQGERGNLGSRLPSLSFDGRFVAFDSSSTNLVSGDANTFGDIFVRDRLQRQTSRVSISSSGVQANGASRNPSISADGRHVAFESDASNLAPPDFSGRVDIFVHDRVTGVTTCVSVDSNGVRGSGDSTLPAISADGRFVAFTSRAPNLVPGDTNNRADIFVHDRVNGGTSRVSVNSSGGESNNENDAAAISRDGRYIAFHSRASNLVASDQNGTADVFVHDRVTGVTTRASVSSGGGEAFGDSLRPTISADGRFVAFDSIAGDLVPGDLIGVTDVFVHDRSTVVTTRVTVGHDGSEALGLSNHSKISADGTVLAFCSVAPNLVPGSSNGFQDVYLYNRTAAHTRRASVSSDGIEGSEHSYLGTISPDGRHVAFFSDASNLTPGDTNLCKDVFLHGSEITLEADPSSASAGDLLKLTAYEGVPGHVASLWIVGLDGAPVIVTIGLGVFAPNHTFDLSITVPPGVGTHDVTLRAYCVGTHSSIERSSDVVVSLR